MRGLHGDSQYSQHKLAATPSQDSMAQRGHRRADTMTTSDWRARRGLSFVQRKEIASDVLEETELRAEEFAKFVSLDRVDPGIVELQLEWDAFVRENDSKLRYGWKPTLGEWSEIKRRLRAIANERRTALVVFGLIVHAIKGRGDPKHVCSIDEALFDGYVARTIRRNARHQFGDAIENVSCVECRKRLDLP
jgi:hypothetical protein